MTVIDDPVPVGRIVLRARDIPRRVLETGCSHVTVDVFDTLLSRLCLPATVVERSCADIARQAGMTVADVVRKRERITRKLRRDASARGLDREFRLRDCIEALLDDVRLDAGPDRVQRAVANEIRLETLSVAAAPGMGRALESLRDAGLTIRFVSDTYLSRSDVASLLDAHGFAGLYDGGFASSDHLLCKYTGNLFDHVVSSMGIDPRRICHLGDNPKSDLVMPDRRGMRSLLFVDRRQLLRLGRLRLASRSADPDDRAGYRHLTRRPASMLHDVHGSSDPLFEVGRSVLAPVAAHMALHVLDRHARDPFSRIVFLAREGLTFMAAARRLSRALSLPVDEDALEYAMVSRAVTTLPAADPEDPLSGGTWRIGTKTRIRSAREFLGQFMLPASLVEAFLPDGEDPDPAGTIDRLRREPRFIEAVRRERSRQLELLTGYLARMGFSDPDARIALVDIGWAGSTQDALARIYPGGPSLHGFYLGLSRRGAPPGPRSRKEGFVIDHVNEGASAVGVQLTAGAIRVCEVLFRAHHGTTLGYRTDGDLVVPVLGPGLREEVGSDPSIADSLSNMWVGFVEGLDDVARAARMETVRPLASRDFARRVMHRFLAYPPPDVARAVTRIGYVQDAGLGILDSLGASGLGRGTAWVPGVLGAWGLRPLQPLFDAACLGYEAARDKGLVRPIEDAQDPGPSRT